MRSRVGLAAFALATALASLAGCVVRSGGHGGGGGGGSSEPPPPPPPPRHTVNAPPPPPPPPPPQPAPNDVGDPNNFGSPSEFEGQREVQVAPPPVKVDNPDPAIRQQPGYLWLAGHWEYHGEWRWKRGHYYRTNGGRPWIGMGWQMKRGSPGVWIWVDGYWKR